MRRPYIQHAKNGHTYYCYPRQPIGFATRGKGTKAHPIFAPGTHLIKVDVSTGKQVKPRNVKLSHGARAIIARQANQRRQLEARQGEAGLNAKVERTLEREHPGMAGEILSQAQEAYHYHNPHAQTNAEPYELEESGYIQEAKSSLGL